MSFICLLVINQKYIVWQLLERSFEKQKNKHLTLFKKKNVFPKEKFVNDSEYSLCLYEKKKHVSGAKNI